METLINQYYTFKNILDNIPLEKLDKLNVSVQTEVPYAIYIEATENSSTNIKVITKIYCINGYGIAYTTEFNINRV